MLNNNIKLLIIKKIRDLYFLFRFGKGSYFFRYIKTLIYCSIKRVLINKKINNIKKKDNKNFSNSWFDDNIDYLIIFLSKEKDKVKNLLEIGSFEDKCSKIAFAIPRFPSEFSKSIGFTL